MPPPEPRAAAGPERGAGSRDRSGARRLELGLALTLLASRPALAGGPTPLTPAWFAARATGGAAQGAAAAAAGGAIPKLQQVQRSVDDLAAAAKAIAAADAFQAAARATASAGASRVPNGVALGGLQPAAGYSTPSAATAWTNATLKPQTASGGRTQVTVKQTAALATLNWTSFNVGAATTLTFDQSAGGSAAGAWVALNRVDDPSLQPSRILGGIQAQGHVFVINLNGIIFGGASQVNVGSLLASTADLTSPPSAGIYGATFSPTVAGATVLVEKGAQITTNTPINVTDAGGGALLLGAIVENDGAITTPDGQALLASGRTFSLTQGFGTQGNVASSTQGTVVAATGPGRTTNAGVIVATTGDVTLAGETVTQAGVAYATSSVATRGTIHLQNVGSDISATVTLAPGSLTQIAPDPGSGAALDSQRAQVLSTLTGGLGSLLPAGPQTSRIEITAGAGVEFQGGSLTLASGGQIAVSSGPSGLAGPSGGRIQIDAGATLDVSGLPDVSLKASADTLTVNVQGFEQRDAPANRDSKTLNNANVSVDLNQLVLVPASAAYPSDRYYTPGGLLEVSGELGNVGHSIQEWDAVGGAISLQAGSVVARSGSVFNIAGGAVSYQAGMAATSWLVSSTGQLWNVNSAPANLDYTGVYGGVTQSHPKWNVTETYVNPLVAPSRSFQSGYTVGRDAGSLTIGAPTVIFAGQIEAGVTPGANQTAPRQADVTDPFLQPQSAVPMPGTLALQALTNAGNPGSASAALPLATDVTIGAGPAPALIPASLSVLPPSSATNTIDLSAAALSASGLGALVVDVTGSAPVAIGTVPAGGVPPVSLATLPVPGALPTGSVAFTAPLSLAPGGQLSIQAFGFVTLGDVTARSGSISVSRSSSSDATPYGDVTVTQNATLDLRGLWTNEALNPASDSGAAFTKGGDVSLSSPNGITLAGGSLIDVSAGATLGPAGAVTGAAGGSVSLAADVRTSSAPPNQAPLVLSGQIRGYSYLGSVSGGSTLALSGPGFLIGDAVAATRAAQTVLPTSFFQLGFQSYSLTGSGVLSAPDGKAIPGVEVAAGASVSVVAPVYQADPTTPLAPSGTAPASALTLVLPAPYLADTVTATLTSRAGASLSLIEAQGAGSTAGGGLLVGAGASVSVDQGQAISLSASDQITVLGSLTAPGGTIKLVNTVPVDLAAIADGATGGYAGAVPGLSIWLGPQSRLDASARAVTAQDRSGRAFGVAPAGGTIAIGSTSSPAFVALRPGAVVDASGASAAVDLQAGSAGPAPGAVAVRDLRTLAGDGGSISIASSSGIYLDGTMRAQAGGPGASGGSLSISLATPVFKTSYPQPLAATPQPTTIPDDDRVPAQITLSQVFPGSGLPASLQPGKPIPLAAVEPSLFGQAALGVDQIEAGGFAGLTLSTTDLLSFSGNVSLHLSRQLTLSAFALGDASLHGVVSLQAPYVSFAPAPALMGQPGAVSGGYTASVSSGGGPAGGATPVAYKNPVCLDGVDVCTSSTLTLSANQIDVSAATSQFGADGMEQLNTTPQGVTPQLEVNQPGFNLVSLVSSGDIRFINGAVTNPGDVSLAAGQVYAATGESGLVQAGANIDPATGKIAFLNPTATLSIARYAGSDPAPPLSAFGTLTLDGPIINQGGVVRAPFGTINLGYVSSILETTAVNFLPGSVTSVSGAGLTVPYGGTTDGISYAYDGAPISTAQSPGITVASTTITVSAGARLDLRGGGTLAGGGGEIKAADGASLVGQGFITGRGGSVDTLVTQLLSFSGGKLVGSAAPVTSTTAAQIYAIVPGYGSGYAPVTPLDLSSSYAGSVPATGEQITVPAGVPGLSAGTYTLLPSYYALLPGGFRVQIAPGAHSVFAGASALLDGSYSVDAALGVAGTGISNALPLVATLTSGPVLRTYSDYNETTYSSFVVSNAAQFGSFRHYIPADAANLTLDFQAPLPIDPEATRLAALGVVETIVGTVPTSPAFSFAGAANLTAAPGGFNGYVSVVAGQTGAATPVPIEVTATGAIATPGYASVPAAALDALDAPTIAIGGSPEAPVNGVIGFTTAGGTGDIRIRSGATLSAGQIFLIAPDTAGITVETGATLTTAAAAAPSYDSGAGFAYRNSSTGAGVSSFSAGVLALSQGFLDFLPPVAQSATATSITVQTGAKLYTGGTLAFVTLGSVTIDPAASYGAKSLDLAVQRINIGSTTNAADTPVGVSITPATLSSLLAGDGAAGTPPLQSLTLTAAGSINLYGSVDFGSASGSLQNVTLNTPAIYGSGAATDKAAIAASGTLTWNGAENPQTQASATPDAPVAGGPGSGLGTLTLSAGRIVLGYAPDSQPADELTLNRIILGFGAVNLNATQEITANNKSTLAVYQSAGAPAASGQPTYAPAALNLNTPLLTEAAGATLGITAGGAVTLASPAGSSAVAATALGGTLTLTGASIASGGVIGLPSGLLTLNATGNISLGAGSVTDLSGRSVAIFDQTETSGGGTLVMESAAGNITLDPAGRIDVSAAAASAGAISATAEAGAVALQGTIAGGADAGFTPGAITIRAGTLAFGGVSQQAAFSALNQSLTAGGVVGARSFEVGSGDLSVGASDSVKAHSVSIAVDAGSLTVTGAIDASGASPGAITLSAGNALTIGGGAVLSVAASSLQTDSDGNSIDAANRGSIRLSSSAGSVALQAGSTLDLSSPDGVARGQVFLDVPRTGADGAAVTAAAGVTIKGAQSIAIDAFRTYAATDASGTVTQAASGIAGSVSLDAIDADDAAFITAALSNQTFLAGIAGLTGPYGSALHLRPGVQITSSAASGGDLAVAGDIDLSGYRYASLNPAAGPVAGVPGSGEPGVLVLRAANNLLIGGSVSDGFGTAIDPNPADATGWQLNVSTGDASAQPVIVPAGLTTPITLNGSATGALFNTRLSQEIVTILPIAAVSLNYAIQIRPAALLADVAIPTIVTLGPATGSGYVVPAGGFTTTATITLPTGAVIPAGTILLAGTTLPTGAVLAAGNVLPFSVNIAPPAGSTAITWPAGATLAVFADTQNVGGGAILASPVQLAAGDIIPQGTVVGFVRDVTSEALRPTAADGTQGVTEALAPLLQGVGSWSIGLVAGANLAAADARAVVPQSSLAALTPGPNGVSGSIALADAHVTFQPGATTEAAPAFSVIRTGTGSLSLAAAGSIVEDSAFGIYTAGTQPLGASTPAGTYAPTGGGDVSVSAQQNIAASQIAVGGAQPLFDAGISNWLIPQGGGGAPGSWAVQFGALTMNGGLSGFVGVGALGGGNVAISAGGDVGEGASVSAGAFTGLDAAVASTGSVVEGAIRQQGGGNLTITVGGAINPIPVANGVNADNGTFTDLRGDVVVHAGSIGQISLLNQYGAVPGLVTAPIDPRPGNPYVSEIAVPTGGPIVVPGDGAASLLTRGDLVLGGAGDAILTSSSAAPNVWFTLWRQTTSISLFSAGGNLTPTTQPQTELAGGGVAVNDVQFGGSYNFLYPPSFTAVAASGSVYYAGNTAGGAAAAVELAPSPAGKLAMVAANSIYATADANGDQLPIDISGADPAGIPTPLNPAYVIGGKTNVLVTSVGGLFAFEPDTPAVEAHANDAQPALFYAGAGDIVGLVTGQTVNFTAASGVTPNVWYVAGKPVQIMAGRDVISLGTGPVAGSTTLIGVTGASYTGGVVFNDDASQISSVVAGRDVVYANEAVAGPGLLFVQAGRNVFQGDLGVLESVGPQVDVTPATRNSGAGITVLAGVGAAGPNWSGFSNLYLDPANLADPATPLQDQPGKAVRNYDAQLLTFLQQRFGFGGDAAQGPAYLATLPQQQQDVFLLQVYYAELNQAGLDYNDPTSRFFKSYIEGTRAIDALFPNTSNGQANPAFGGSLTLFSGLGSGASAGQTIDGGIRTDFGGSIEAAVPAGAITIGVQGVIPGSATTSKPGVITQGAGNIDLYASGSVGLGLSRIFTTFGGDILIWSEDGDIAAGSGAKSTVVFAPASITYDVFGDITLSPTVPTTGAGIATLAPIAEVPPGDINLIAPNGVIDAGEAGIRASGNANFAALLIVNSANIQVMGKTTGIPVVAVPNVGAETAAAAAGGANSNTNVAAGNKAPPPPPSIISVEVIGYGGSDQDVTDEERRRRKGAQ